MVRKSFGDTVANMVCALKVENASHSAAKVLQNVELALGMSTISCYFSLSGSQSICICVKTRDTGTEYGLNEAGEEGNMGYLQHM